MAGCFVSLGAHRGAQAYDEAIVGLDQFAFDRPCTNECCTNLKKEFREHTEAGQDSDRAKEVAYVVSTRQVVERGNYVSVMILGLVLIGALLTVAANLPSAEPRSEGDDSSNRAFWASVADAVIAAACFLLGGDIDLFRR